MRFPMCVVHQSGHGLCGTFLEGSNRQIPRTILSVDGIGTCDHVLRASMLGRLARMPKARAILPFVQLFYASPSGWMSQEGLAQCTKQRAVSKETPSCPFCSQWASKMRWRKWLFPSLCAYLDDVYSVCQPDRVVTLFKILNASLFTVAGIRLYQGKTKAWNRGGVVPKDGDRLGPKRGKKSAGDSYPIGAVCVGKDRRTDRGRTTVVGRHPRGARFSMCLANLGAKCQSSSNHTLGTLPPSLSHVYGEAHDTDIWNTVVAIMHGLPGSHVEVEEARQVATLPVRMGGLGLRSATRASWADAPPQVGQRNPKVANTVLRTVSQREPPHQGCLTELHQAGARLDREGFWWRTIMAVVA